MKESSHTTRTRIVHIPKTQVSRGTITDLSMLSSNDPTKHETTMYECGDQLRPTDVTKNGDTSQKPGYTVKIPKSYTCKNPLAMEAVLIAADDYTLDRLERLCLREGQFVRDGPIGTSDCVYSRWLAKQQRRKELMEFQETPGYENYDESESCCLDYFGSRSLNKNVDFVQGGPLDEGNMVPGKVKEEEKERMRKEEVSETEERQSMNENRLRYMRGMMARKMRLGSDDVDVQDIVTKTVEVHFGKENAQETQANVVQAVQIDDVNAETKSISIR